MLAATLGVNLGEVKFCVDSRSGAFATELTKCGVGHGSIFTTPQEAHDSCRDGYGDTVVIFPGVWNLTAQLTWTNDVCHLVGAYAPTLYGAQARISSSGTTAVVSTAAITCKESQFHRFQITNSANIAAANAVTLGDGATVASLNNYFKYVGMAAPHGSGTSLGSATSCSLKMYGAASTFFDHCQIGDTISQKTASSGMLRFSAVTNGVGNQNNTWEKCKFFSWSNTSGSYIVLNDGANAMDRVNFFDDCFFFNFDNGGAKPAAVFHMPAGTPTGYHVSLHNCMQQGSTAWLSATSVAANVTISMVAAEATGGTAINPT
jgi:hypothetical protein